MINKNNVKKYSEIIVCILILILISIFFSAKHFDNDLFFDLKTGENILKYGVDFKEHFSFIPNLTYLYHHWFYDLIVHSINTNFGLFGIKMFFLSIFFIFSLIYYLACYKLTNNRLVSILVTVITMYFSRIYFTTRVQSITNVLFFLEILLLNKMYFSDKKRYLFLLLILCISIVNLHMPLWIFSLVLFLPFLCSSIISYFFRNKKIKNILIEKPANYKYLLIALLMILISGFISPYGVRVYTFFIKYIGTNGYDYFMIIELRKTPLILYKYGLLITLLLIIGLYLKMLKFNLKDFFLLIGLFVFSLLSTRNAVYLYLIGPYLLLKNLSVKKINLKRKIVINKTIINLVSIPFLIIIIFYGLRVIDYPNNNYKMNKTYPVEIVEYMKENLDIKNIRLYNGFGYGSYIEYNDIPVFIDSRAEVYIKEFNGGYNIAKDYADSLMINEYEKVYKKYHFNYALVPKKSQLDYYYRNNKYFKKIKADKYYILYSVDEKLYN